MNRDINHIDILDNLVEGTGLRNQICLEEKASLLVEASITSSRWPAFMKSEFATDRELKLECGQNKYYCGKSLKLSKPTPDCRCQTVLQMDLHGGLQFYNGYRLSYLFPQDIFELLKQETTWEDSLRMSALEALGSAYNVARIFSRCKSPEQICNYWRQEPYPFAALNGVREMFSVPFNDDDDFRNLQPWLKIHSIAGNTPWYDEFGNIIMWIVKMRTQDGGKIHVPVSQWFRSGSGVPMLFCVPICVSGKLPLFQLPKLKNCAGKTVIVTDSIELAAANAEDDSAIWTTWIGDLQYSNWNILREAAEVLLLVTNHSGKGLPEAYLEIDRLKRYLKDDIGLENLGALQLAVEYSDGEPYAIQRSFRALSLAEFEQMVEKAHEALQPASPFWLDGQASSSQESAGNTTAELLATKLEPYPYLVRNFVVRDSVTLLHAAKGIGKSMLAYSIAVAVAADKQIDLCPGMWWVTPKKGHKVLYLDFENSKSQIANRLSKICQAYWGKEGDSAKRNLAIKYGNELPAENYAMPEHHATVLRWLEDAEHELSGHIDLIVLDPYSRFVNSRENTRTVADFTALCRKITKRGTAILIVHHSNAEGDVRGFREKRDQVCCAVSLLREDGAAARDLDEAPLTVHWESLREPDYSPDQQIRFIDGRWLPAGVDDVTQLREENFKLIVAKYRKIGFTDKDIQTMLAVSNGSFYAKMKE